MIKKIITKIKGFLFVPKVRIKKLSSSTMIFTDKEIKKINSEIRKNINTKHVEADYVYNWYRK